LLGKPSKIEATICTLFFGKTIDCPLEVVVVDNNCLIAESFCSWALPAAHVLRKPVLQVGQGPGTRLFRLGRLLSIQIDEIFEYLKSIKLADVFNTQLTHG
jgi:hypothetical protein